MTLDELKAKLDDEHYAQAVFDKEFEGSCPCGGGKIDVDGHEVEIWARCWRVSEQMDGGYQDLHLTTEHPKKKEIAKLLIRNLNNQKWYNPYKLIKDNS